MNIEYICGVKDLKHEQLQGFFVDWPNPPDSQTHLKILSNSHTVWLAFDGEKCVGFINAISDNVFYAFIPLLEVLPEYQKHGIGAELVRHMTESLKGMYAIDLLCDESVAAFYEKKGYSQAIGMSKRNYQNQNGNP